MQLRNMFFSIVLAAALIEYTPALVFAEHGILSAESQFYHVIGLDYMAGLFGLVID